MSDVLNRQRVLEAKDRRIVPVDVPEWGGRVFVRSMTSVERLDWELKWSNWKKIHELSPDEPTHFEAYFATFVVCDADGALMFTPNDTEALGGKNGAALDRIYRAAAPINGLSQAEIERAAKNSATAPNGSPGSGSPGNSAAPSTKPSTG